MLLCRYIFVIYLIVSKVHIFRDICYFISQRYLLLPIHMFFSCSPKIHCYDLVLLNKTYCYN